MRQATFRAIFAGLVINDRVASERSPGEPLVQPLWPQLLLAVAQSCALGAPIDREAFGDAFWQVSQESLAGCLLGALPVLLLNIDRYGHRQAYIRRWATELELPDGAISGVIALFIHLCQIHDLRQPSSFMMDAPHKPDQNQDQQPENACEASPLVATQQLVKQVQGQFWLGLQLAHRQGWSPAQMGLVALLTTIQGGLWAIPLKLRQGLDLQPQETLPEETPSAGWSWAERQQLLQAGTELYFQWSGIQGSPKLAVSGDYVAVTL